MVEINLGSIVCDYIELVINHSDLYSDQTLYQYFSTNFCGTLEEFDFQEIYVIPKEEKVGNGK